MSVSPDSQYIEQRAAELYEKAPAQALALIHQTVEESFQFQCDSFVYPGLQAKDYRAARNGTS